MRLATLPGLREVSRVDSALKPCEVGKQMRVWLGRNIKTIRDIEIGGNLVARATAVKCLELTLGFNGAWMSLPDRRYVVLRDLGIPFSVGQMRRPHSPEFELLRRLAEHLVATS